MCTVQQVRYLNKICFNTCCLEYTGIPTVRWYFASSCMSGDCSQFPPTTPQGEPEDRDEAAEARGGAPTQGEEERGSQVYNTYYNYKTAV